MNNEDKYSRLPDCLNDLPEQSKCHLTAEHGDHPIQVMDHSSRFAIIAADHNASAVWKLLLEDHSNVDEDDSYTTRLDTSTIEEEIKIAKQQFARAIRQIILLQDTGITAQVYDIVLDKDDPTQGLMLKLERLYDRKDFYDYLDDAISRDPDTGHQKAMTLAYQLAKNIQAVHNRGILHKDIKPSNVMLQINPPQAPTVKLIDFDIAAPIVTELSEVSEYEASQGTMPFMPPESRRHDYIPSVSSDIYGFGATLYDCINGIDYLDKVVAHKFLLHTQTERDSYSRYELYEAALLFQYEQQIEPNLNEDFPDVVPQEIREIICKCMAINPEDRYQTMDEVIADIESYLEENTCEWSKNLPAIGVHEITPAEIKSPHFPKITDEDISSAVNQIQEIADLN